MLAIAMASFSDGIRLWLGDSHHNFHLGQASSSRYIHFLPAIYLVRLLSLTGSLECVIVVLVLGDSDVHLQSAIIFKTYMKPPFSTLYISFHIR